MPTRFYLPSTGAPAEAPAPSAGWNQTSGYDSIAAVTSKISSAFVAKTVTHPGLGSGSDFMLVRQYVSAGLATQTLSSIVSPWTIKAYARTKEGAAADNARSYLIIRVYRPSDDSIVGTLFNSTSPANNHEWDNGTATNRKFPQLGDAANVSELSVTSGDVIVFEFGARVAADRASQATIRFGDVTGTDCVENQTDTTENDPWIEFSGTINFASGAQTHMLAATVTGTATVEGTLRLSKLLAATVAGVTAIVASLAGGARRRKKNLFRVW